MERVPRWPTNARSLGRRCSPILALWAIPHRSLLKLLTKSLSYVGYEQVPANAQALLIADNSSIDSNTGLKRQTDCGSKRGSSAHELLAKFLQKAGLSWQDIQPIWLPPADARAAFDKQSIDAWAIWEPYLSAAEQDARAKVLIEWRRSSTNLFFLYW